MTDAKKAAGDKINKVKKKISAVKDTVQDAVADHVETAQLHAMEAADTIMDQAETAQLHALDLQDQIGEFVRRQPVASLGIAVGAGILVGALVSRR